MKCWDGVHRPQNQCPPPDGNDPLYQEYVRRLVETILYQSPHGPYPGDFLDTGETLPETLAKMPVEALEAFLAQDDLNEAMREAIEQALALKLADAASAADTAADTPDEPQTKWWQGPIPIIAAIGLGLAALFRRS